MPHTGQYMGEESTTSNAVGCEEATEKPDSGNPVFGGWRSLQKAERRRDGPEISAMVQ
jgi:hypothetical protein